MTEIILKTSYAGIETKTGKANAKAIRELLAKFGAVKSGCCDKGAYFKVADADGFARAVNSIERICEICDE